MLWPILTHHCVSSSFFFVLVYFCASQRIVKLLPQHLVWSFFFGREKIVCQLYNELCVHALSIFLIAFILPYHRSSSANIFFLVSFKIKNHTHCVHCIKCLFSAMAPHSQSEHILYVNNALSLPRIPYSIFYSIFLSIFSRHFFTYNFVSVPHFFFFEFNIEFCYLEIPK